MRTVPEEVVVSEDVTPPCRWSCWIARSAPLRETIVVTTTGPLWPSGRFSEAFLLSRVESVGLRGQRFPFRVAEELRPFVDAGDFDLEDFATDWSRQQVERDLLEWCQNQPTGTPLPPPPIFRPRGCAHDVGSDQSADRRSVPEEQCPEFAHTAIDRSSRGTHASPDPRG